VVVEKDLNLLLQRSQLDVWPTQGKIVYLEIKKTQAYSVIKIVFIGWYFRVEIQLKTVVPTVFDQF
jgi:hypothetical protein